MSKPRWAHFMSERAATAFLDRYGADLVDAPIVELKLRSEQIMRSYIETIPDGVYSFSSDPRQRRRGEKAADSACRCRGSRIEPYIRFFAQQSPLQGSHEFSVGDHPISRLHCHQAHLPGRASQCWLFQTN